VRVVYRNAVKLQSPGFAPNLSKGAPCVNNKNQTFTPTALHNSVTCRPSARDAICETPLGFVFVSRTVTQGALRDPGLWT
jgi:hypothetical protein